jgi:hypothetical protein
MRNRRYHHLRRSGDEPRALHPFITQLERAAGFARDDAVEQRLGKLRELLASGARSDDEIELLAELLSLPSTAAGLNLSPQCVLLHRVEHAGYPMRA